MINIIIFNYYLEQIENDLNYAYGDDGKSATPLANGNFRKQDPTISFDHMGWRYP